ncbi:MAG: hypothetical protein IJ692_04555 [Alloprevotella sp.]|nr:hypothetical protein [Alloprevotella sp.]
MKDTNDKRSPFVVPEGYFESFPAQMMACIDAYEETAKSHPVTMRIHYADRIRRFTHYAVGVAATAAFFLIFTHKAPVASATPAPAADTHMNFVASNGADQLYDYMLLTTNDVYNYASSLD